MEQHLWDDENVRIWERRLGKEILKTNESIARWNRRKLELEEYCRSNPSYVRAQVMEGDLALRDAMGAYQFHSGEVVRLAAQIGAAAHLRSMAEPRRAQTPTDLSVTGGSEKPRQFCRRCQRGISKFGKGWEHTHSGMAKCDDLQGMAKP